MSTREQLESERDFLLKSLDDLELERSSGGIDEESYTALHDDYTARTAATLRALRDGVDARPTASRKTPPGRRRVTVVAVIVVFAVVAGVALAGAVGVRLPGQTSSGNSPSSSTAAGGQITSLKAQVKQNPQSYDLRLALAQAYANDNDLLTAIKQWDAAITIDANRPEAFAERGRALYIVSQQLPDKDAQAQFVANASAALDKAVEVDPDYADAHYFRAVLRAALGKFADAQTDLQTYLARSPGGEWRAQAVDLLARVTATLAGTSTTVPASP